MSINQIINAQYIKPKTHNDDNIKHNLVNSSIVDDEDDEDEEYIQQSIKNIYTDYIEDGDEDTDIENSNTIIINMDNMDNSPTIESTIESTIEPIKQKISKTKEKPLIKIKSLAKVKSLAKSKAGLKIDAEIKAEDNFMFDEDNINLFSKDLDINTVLIRHSYNSKYPNDTNIICLLLRTKIIKEYHCSRNKCKVGKTWIGQPIQLKLNRINNTDHDLTINNLELICGNCFMVTYGLNLFKKTINTSVLVCKHCEYPLNKFNNYKKKAGICNGCDKKMCDIAFQKGQSDYNIKLSNTYNSNPALSDNIKLSNSPKLMSYDKSYDTNTQSNTKQLNTNQSNTNQTNTSKPLIKLNMKILELQDLQDLQDLHE